MKKNRTLPLQSLLLMLLALFVALPADAALVRRAGTTVAQDSFNETRLLVEGLEVDVIFMSGGTVHSQYSLNSFYLGAYATPAYDCWFNHQTLEHGGIVHTDCDWGFEQGEMLTLEGTVDKFLPGSNYDLTWIIWGGGKTWQFDGTFASDAPAGRSGPVYLNVAMPADMLPGDYLVSLMFSQTAPEGHSYWGYSNILDPGPNYCITVDDPPREICGQVGYEHSQLDYTSTPDNLRVFARQVPLPATLPLFATGVLLLGAMRRQQSRRK